MDDLSIGQLKAEAIYNFLKDEPKKYMNEEIVSGYGCKISDLLLVAKKNDFYFDEEQKQPDYYGLAFYLKHFEHLFFNEYGGFIWDKTKNHYVRVNDDFLNQKVGELTSMKVKPRQLRSFIDIIRMVCFEQDKLEKPDGKINLLNGVLEIKTGRLLKHTPEMFFQSIIPIEYKKEANAPNWIQFLNNIFPENPELITVAAQIFGYILLGGYPFLHKSFVLYGDGRNGKSTFLHILEKLVGRENFSSVSLSCLDKPFSVYNLFGKTVNISGETPTDKINAEIFKQATTGENLTAAKKYQDEFTFPCHARFIFACNELPRFGESTVGMEERLYFIPFKRFFKKEERDHGIKAKLETELSGILNWALSGLQILLAEKRLPELSVSEDVMNDYRIENDSVYSWVEENLHKDDSILSPISSRNIYPKYKDDTKNMGRHPVSEPTFSKRLRKFLKSKDWFNESEMFDKKLKIYKKIAIKSDAKMYNGASKLPEYYI